VRSLFTPFRVAVLLALAWLGLISQAPSVNAPFRVRLGPAFVTRGPGTDLDTIAFRESQDPARTLMFVTAQGNDLVEAWRFDAAGQPLLDFTLGASASEGCLSGPEVNGVVVDPRTGRLYVTVSNPSNRVCVFAVSDSGARFERRLDVGRNLGQEPNLGLLHLASGRTRLYVSADTRIFPFDVTDLGDVRPEAEFRTSTGIETLAGDDAHQRLYVPDEKGGTGVYVYDPDGRAVPGFERFGQGVFAADAEGILVYPCRAADGTDGGAGFVVVSDQTDPVNQYELFDRASGRFLGTLEIAGANHTDGIASTQQALPGYPQGMFVAVDDDAATVGVGWSDVLAATGLGCR
jgi:hypothetical protein